MELSSRTWWENLAPFSSQKGKNQRAQLKKELSIWVRKGRGGELAGGGGVGCGGGGGGGGGWCLGSSGGKKKSRGGDGGRRGGEKVTEVSFLLGG